MRNLKNNVIQMYPVYEFVKMMAKNVFSNVLKCTVYTVQSHGLRSRSYRSLRGPSDSGASTACRFGHSVRLEKEAA